MALRKIIFSLVLFLSFFIALSYAVETGTIEGTVKTKDGKPIFNATIVLKNTGHKVFSNVDGTYIIEDIQPGIFSIFVYKYGYKTVLVKKIGIKSGLTTRVKFKLQPDPQNQGCGNIVGSIVDEKNIAVSGAKVIVTQAMVPKSSKRLTYEDFIVERSKIESRSGNNGKFRIEKIPPGRYFLLVLQDGYQPYLHYAVYVETGKTKEINVKLASAQYGKIVGVIKSTNRDLIPGANIVLTGTRLGAASDASGNFLINNIPPGKYIVKASMLGFKSWQQSVIVIRGRITKLDVVIEPETFSKHRRISELDKLKQRVENLRQAYFYAENETERSATVNKLHVVLKKLFKLKEKKYAREIETQKRNLQMLEQMQRNRSQHQQDIIERRIKELLTVY